MGYKQVDMFDDNKDEIKTGMVEALAELQESINCFTCMLGILLEPNTGMIIVIPEQEDKPEARHGKYFFYHDAHNGQIAGYRVTPDHVLAKHEHGQLIKIGDDEEQ